VTSHISAVSFIITPCTFCLNLDAGTREPFESRRHHRCLTGFSFLKRGSVTWQTNVARPARSQTASYNWMMHEEYNYGSMDEDASLSFCYLWIAENDDPNLNPELICS
jgi:hypothetical protein